MADQGASGAIPAGWYLDPQAPGGAVQRYHDGVAWTEHTAPVAAPGGQGSDSPSRGNDKAGTSPLVEGITVAALSELAKERVDAVHIPPMPTHKKSLFGGKKELEEENAELRRLLEMIGVAERDALAAELEILKAQLSEGRGLLAELESEIVETNDLVLLQEAGIYDYSHPLDSSIEYKDHLDDLKAQVKKLARDGNAVTGAQTWLVNGSAAEGQRMMRETSKLMLRAYMAEADNCVRGVKPASREATVERLSKARDMITKLGKTMQIEIGTQLHALRINEIRLTADFLAKKEVEKELERERKAQMREEEKVRREIEAEQARLIKEYKQYEEARKQLEQNGDAQGVAELDAKLNEINEGLNGLAERAANTRAGHVYVISNIGAFGDRMVKIGLTRRLVPMDRIKELSDASVPFHYDVHALFFSDDAVQLETDLHHRFAKLRVNFVNQRREFFYVTPAEVRDALIDLHGHVLEFTEVAEASEFRQSQVERVKNRSEDTPLN